jgi:arginase family enzyme
MLNKSVRVLNFDDSVIKQSRLISEYNPEIVDLKSVGPLARHWMSKRIGEEIKGRLHAQSANSVTFLGSGDFHHISSILINQFSEPLSVIVFDLHPDWDTLPPRRGCGSWVTQTLKNKNIEKLILIGVSSEDISSGRLQSANLASLKDNRVEIYPYAHRPSRVFLRRVPENISFRVEKHLLSSRIYWDELKGKSLKEFFMSILKRIPTKKVYISIDKDCLKSEDALTNWEEGCMLLDDLLLVLKLIKENLDIAGVDIAGDYSRVSIKNKIKSLASYFDHPRDIIPDRMSEPATTAVNERTNLKILNLLFS